MVQICTHVILKGENSTFTNVNTTFLTIHVSLHIALRYFLDRISNSSSWYKFLENTICILKNVLFIFKIYKCN